MLGSVFPAVDESTHRAIANEYIAQRFSQSRFHQNTCSACNLMGTEPDFVHQLGYGGLGFRCRGRLLIVLLPDGYFDL